MRECEYVCDVMHTRENIDITAYPFTTTRYKKLSFICIQSLQMLYLVNDKFKYIIGCFPKSGCSTIRRVHVNLLEHVPFEDLKEQGIRNMHSFLSGCKFECDCSNCLQLRNMLNVDIEPYSIYHYVQRYNIPEEEFQLKYSDYYLTVVYRDTFSRVCSLLYDKLLLTPYPEDSRKITVYRERYYEHCKTFVDFLALLRDTWFTDHFFVMHTHPQIIPSFILEREPVIVNLKNVYSLFQDHPSSELKTLFAKHLSAIGEINSTRKQHLEQKVDLTTYDFVVDPLGLDIENKGVPAYDCLRTEATIELVKSIYGEEIVFFKQNVA